MRLLDVIEDWLSSFTAESVTRRGINYTVGVPAIELGHDKIIAVKDDWIFCRIGRWHRIRLCDPDCLETLRSLLGPISDRQR